MRKPAASRTLPARDVFGARPILALGDGQTHNRIMTLLQTSAPTISNRWKQRFEQEGLDGLDPRHKGQSAARGRRGVASRNRAQEAAKADRQIDPWSCRTIAEALGLSKSTLQSVRAQTRLKPLRLDGYMASNDSAI